MDSNARLLMKKAGSKEGMQLNETEKHLSSQEEKKAIIRKRYLGVDKDQLSVIPASPKPDIFDQERALRVAIYARVSTGDPNQTSSYELQKNHYTDLVKRNPNWTLVDIYADEGISGTSLRHRDAFLRMIADCQAGKIDLIVTKSVSRFARNLLDGVGYVRKLAAMNPPVSVFFETENINTLNKDSEMSLAFLSTMAQEESHNKSEIMNVSVEMRFQRGVFLLRPLLGFDLDENGNLVINEEEAKTVRLIFFMFIFGYSCSQIAETLTRLKRRTKNGNVEWTGGTVKSQLTNERHCGSVLARKTFTPNYLDHKSKKNRKDRNQYFQEVHHDPIISRSDFIYVQHLLQNRNGFGENILPMLQAIPGGTLSGFVCVNPRWTGFKPDDYFAASKRACDDETEASGDRDLTISEGEFDLRGYEVVRSQFLDVSNRMSLSFTAGRIRFSNSCIAKLAADSVEILIHPVKRLIAVRPAAKDNRLGFQWSRVKDGVRLAKDIGASCIMPCIYGLLNWSLDNRYRAYGTYSETGEGGILFFSCSDAEIFIPRDTDDGDPSRDGLPDFPDGMEPLGTKKSLLAFPASWADGFGAEYYAHRSFYDAYVPKKHAPLILSSEVVAYNPTPEIEIPDPAIVERKLKAVLDDITLEGKENEQQS